MTSERLPHVIMLKISDTLYDRLAARKRSTGCFISEFCRRAIKASLDREAAQEAVAALQKESPSVGGQK